MQEEMTRKQFVDGIYASRKVQYFLEVEPQLRSLLDLAKSSIADRWALYEACKFRFSQLQSQNKQISNAESYESFMQIVNRLLPIEREMEEARMTPQEVYDIWFVEERA